MTLTSDEHCKLAQNLKKIFNFILDNVIPKIRRDIKIDIEYHGNHTISFFIYANRKKCFEIKYVEKNKYYYFPGMEKLFNNNNIDTYEGYINFYNSREHNLLTDEDAMFGFIENWHKIKAVYEKCIELDATIIDKIKNFEI